MGIRIQFKCGYCVWLHKKLKKTACSDKGVTKWDEPCKNWMPISRDFEGPLVDIQRAISELTQDELEVVQWLIDKKRGLEEVERKTGRKLGEEIQVKVQDEWVKGRIEGLTLEHVEGTTENGVRFLVLHNSTKPLQ